jgi:hypothetical protein
MAAGNPNLDDVYVILRAWAFSKGRKTYGELSAEYHTRTGDWFEPHGSWDAPLGDLNKHLHARVGAPALSALVVLKLHGEPGAAFWGSAPSVPSRPRTDIERLAQWARIVQEVHDYTWPAALP